ncbi:hypothetical protein [Paenibacillus alkalitolerans]|uniref:hypothetical protein n=1 Tax=Paenibacillus alkalitolerans TaxID=2799335 RepID=UPI0018F4A8AE|nr:hypothetical protein [Paenibacillus alkalitolerans]
MTNNKDNIKSKYKKIPIKNRTILKEIDLDEFLIQDLTICLQMDEKKRLDQLLKQQIEQK